jgi:hypothetical protein
VIACAGTFKSLEILEPSGIRQSEKLAAAGIRSLRDLLCVGGKNAFCVA